MMTLDELIKIKRALERAEGYVNAAAWKETSEPPHGIGQACKDRVSVREALASLQRACSGQE
jgi:hypothetical protein